MNKKGKWVVEKEKKTERRRNKKKRRKGNSRNMKMVRRVVGNKKTVGA